MNLSPSIYVSLLGISVACSSPSATAASANPVEVDAVEGVRGVPDRGAHPAVVILDVGGGAPCSGALVAPDVVLTARHCVARTSTRIDCPPAAGEVQIDGPRTASSIRVLAGDDAKTAKLAALGRQILAPPSPLLCGADIALLLLDREIDAEPYVVRATGVAQGDHVITVGFGGAARLERDHVEVVQTTADELVVAEATCEGESGGPALDEQTGEIVGVLSRGGPTCDGPRAYDVYTRVDAYRKLIEGAMARGVKRKKDGGTTKKPPTDVGAACKHAADCAAGVCVSDQGSQFCSRSCGVGDHCPAHFRCQKDGKGHEVCVEH
jgi:secreted trypsin-like serine protease